jgi:hypothetical protein
MKRLTRADIAEVVGLDDLSSLRELEILFLGVEELGALQHCPHLLRLSLIDNGLKRLSNLTPLGPSLLTLCICDQDIKKMENLNLPNLKELFLHRNQISVIEGLEQCPRLRRLWLFQNDITAVGGLHALPELEECWLQGNRIASLHGLEASATLVSLALGGNAISEYTELHRLAGLAGLTTLSLQDVHFGRCPIVDDPGYRNFCVCYLPQISYLDGVLLNPDHQKVALLSHAAEVGSYNDRIALVESTIKAEIHGVELKQQASRSHLAVLEREMTEALRELEGLIADGRTSMSKQVKKQKKLMESNFRSLERNIGQEKSKATSALNACAAGLHAEHDVSEALFCVLERATSAEIGILDAFAQCTELAAAARAASPPRAHAAFAYQTIGDSSPDFLRVASLLPLNHQFSGVPSAVLLKLFRTGRYDDSDDPVSQGAVPKGGAGAGEGEGAGVVECYSIMSLRQLRGLLSVGLGEGGEGGRDSGSEADGEGEGEAGSLVFLTDPAVAVSLFCSSSGPLEKACFGAAEVVPPLTSIDGGEDRAADEATAAENMPTYKSARNAKLLLLVSCELDVSLLDLSGAAPPRIRLPASTSARQEMAADLRRARKPVAFEMEIPLAAREGSPAAAPPVSHIYTVPEAVCHQAFAATRQRQRGAHTDTDSSDAFPVEVRFVSMCVSPLVDGVVGIGGLKALEIKLELILTPSEGSGGASPGSSKYARYCAMLRMSCTAAADT